MLSYKSIYIILVFVWHSYEKPLEVKWISQFMSFDVHFFCVFFFRFFRTANVLWRCIAADFYLHVVLVAIVVVASTTLSSLATLAGRLSGFVALYWLLEY